MRTSAFARMPVVTMLGMKTTDVRPGSRRPAFALLGAIGAIAFTQFAATTAWSADAASVPSTPSNLVRGAWHDTAADAAPVTWSFAAPQQAAGAAWTVERGRMTPGATEAELRPDTSRRVILISPPALPELVRYAEEFVVNVPADGGLQRVRVQARRDARGGWITIADGKGTGLRATPAGVAVKRTPGARNLPIDALRVELTFRTTNPRGLVSIAALPAAPR